MQIAVAAPHLAGGAPSIEQAAVDFDGARHLGAQRRDALGGEDLGTGRHILGVFGNDLGQGVGAAEGRAMDLRRLVQGETGIGQLNHPVGGERAPVGQAVEGQGFVETPHDHRPFDGRARARRVEHIEMQAALRGAAQRDDAEINLRRGAPVEDDLRLAGRPARRDLGEIDEAVPDGALEFVNQVPGQKDIGDMGLNMDHLTRPKPMGRRIGQHGDGVGLLVRRPGSRHRRPIRCRRSGRAF